ncbi:MAG: carbohydrate kinase family protein [Patescibacteria group bacterium]
MAMKQPHVMTVGGATFDLFVRTGGAVATGEGGRSLCFPVGAKIGVEQIIETCGGGASNTAVGLGRLGCAAAFCGVVGNDQWGERMLRNLQENGVDVSPATVVEGENSSSSIILSVGSGERIILYNAGSNIHLHDVTFDKAKAQEQDWIYLTHLQKLSSQILDDLAALTEGNDRIGITWNPGGTQVKAGWDAADIRPLLARTDILLLNREEALGFTHSASVDEALKTLLGAGAKTVCVTDGREGATATDGTQVFHCPPLEDAEAVDTTGAGDAFGTGLTWALLTGLDLSTALRAGTINATSVLGSIGAQAGLLTNTEMTKRLSSLDLPVQSRPLHA